MGFFIAYQKTAAKKIILCEDVDFGERRYPKDANARLRIGTRR